MSLSVILQCDPANGDQCTLVLVEKEKKGHSYTSTRHPTLSDEKKAKLKSFTKEYSHKLLKKLREKGRLRRIPSAKSNGSSSTPMTFSTPTRVPPDTPNGSDGRHDDLLDEMFGVVDGDGDEGMDGDEDMDPSPPDIATPYASLIASPIAKLKRNGTDGLDLGGTPSSVGRDEEG